MSTQSSAASKPRLRILTGDRPTGRLHLGHYVGSLKARVALQDTYECFFIIADLHTLTTKPAKDDIARLHDNIREMVLDYLAVGIDPEKSVIFVQSAVPETYQLNLIFEMLVTLPRLTRLPSIKDMARAANMDDEAIPFGLVGYPVLQAADILLPRAHLVPVGKDNQAHVEITREIARRFNRLYGEVFPLPKALIGEVPTLLGIYGKAKMSKSLNNAIFLSDSPEEVAAKVRRMHTDPTRVRPDIPADPDKPTNVVFRFHDIFNPDKDEVNELKERYRQGKVGDVEVKKRLIRALNAFLDPIRERRAYYARRPDLVEDILLEGTRRMREEARATMTLVWDAMGMYGPTDLARRLDQAARG